MFGGEKLANYIDIHDQHLHGHESTGTFNAVNTHACQLGMHWQIKTLMRIKSESMHVIFAFC